MLIILLISVRGDKNLFLFYFIIRVEYNASFWCSFVYGNFMLKTLETDYLAIIQWQLFYHCCALFKRIPIFYILQQENKQNTSPGLKINDVKNLR